MSENNSRTIRELIELFAAKTLEAKGFQYIMRKVKKFVNFNYLKSLSNFPKMSFIVPNPTTDRSVNLRKYALSFLSSKVFLVISDKGI